MVFQIRVVIAIMIMASCSQAQSPADAELRQEARRQTESIQNGGRLWPVKVTDFFEIHYLPSTVPDSVACVELDAFVERTLTQIDDSGTQVNALRHHKMSYYLCDDATVERLTGYRTKGMADLAGRAVISSHFPHFHELVHLLVDITMQKSALQTHPLLQEGIACLLGGRWGRAPATILYTSWVHRSFGMGQLDGVITRDAFFSCGGGPDVAYGIGTMLCEVVRQEAGYGGLMDLYETLSGSVEFVSSLTADDVYREVAAVCQWEGGAPKELLDGAMESAWLDWRRCGVAPPGSPPKEAPARKLSLEGGGVKIWYGNQGCLFQIQSDDYPVYLLSPASPQTGNSSLFAEHLGPEKYQGQRYGLRCSPDDIALYDFATNQLLATWVSSFTDEVGACDGPDMSLLFKLTDPAANAAEWLAADGCQMVH